MILKFDSGWLCVLFYRFIWQIISQSSIIINKSDFPSDSSPRQFVAFSAEVDDGECAQQRQPKIHVNASSPCWLFFPSIILISPSVARVWGTSKDPLGFHVHHMLEGKINLFSHMKNHRASNERNPPCECSHIHLIINLQFREWITLRLSQVEETCREWCMSRQMFLSGWLKKVVMRDFVGDECASQGIQLCLDVCWDKMCACSTCAWVIALLTSRCSWLD